MFIFLYRLTGGDDHADQRGGGGVGGGGTCPLSHSFVSGIGILPVTLLAIMVTVNSDTISADKQNGSAML